MDGGGGGGGGPEKVGDRKNEKIVSLIGRLDPGSYCLKFEVPDGVLPVGTLRILLIKFSYCEEDGQGHRHFGALPEIPYPGRLEPPAQVEYIPQVANLAMAYPRRRTTFHITADEGMARRRSGRLEVPDFPVVMRQAPVPVVAQPVANPPAQQAPAPAQQAPAPAQIGAANPQAQPAQIGGGGGGGGGGGAQPANYADDDDEEGGGGGGGAEENKRFKRAPRELGQREVRLTFMVEPDSGEKRLDVTVKNENLDTTTSTLSDIVKYLNNLVGEWHDALGEIYFQGYQAAEREGPLRKHLPPKVELVPPNIPQALPAPQRKALADQRLLSITLPPNFGLALKSADQWRMLGLKTAELGNVRQKESRRNWVVGNPNPGAKYLVGKPNAKGESTVYLSDVPVSPIETGPELLEAWKYTQKKGPYQPERDYETLIFAPRAVIDPSVYEYDVDLQFYKPPDEKRKSAAMLAALVECVMEAARKIYGIRSGYKIIGIAENNIRILAQFNPKKRSACFATWVEFGSRPLANEFGLSDLHFEMDTRKHPGEELVSVSKISLSQQARVQRGRDVAYLSEEEYEELSVNFGNIVHVSQPEDLGNFAYAEAAKQKFNLWKAERARDFEDRFEEALENIPEEEEEEDGGGRRSPVIAVPAPPQIQDLQPVDQPPVLQQPADVQPPAQQPPVLQPPAQQPPAVQPPAQQPPVGPPFQIPARPVGPRHPIVRPPAPRFVPPAPNRFFRANLNLGLPASFLPVNSPDRNPCRGLGGGLNVPAPQNPPLATDFPQAFFVFSEEGVRNDFVQELGSVCLAASFKNGGREHDRDSAGFVLENWSMSARTLNFCLFSAPALLPYRNNKANVVGLARCTFLCQVV